jgi:hypothetical protein
MSSERINLSGGSFFEGWSDEEIKSYRATMREVAADLPGAMARYAEAHPEEARKYREAEESVIRARREGEKWGAEHYIID